MSYESELEEIKRRLDALEKKQIQLDVDMTLAEAHEHLHWLTYDQNGDIRGDDNT